MGKAMSDVLSRQDKRVVMEGQEPAEFWVALGGKAPYANDKKYAQTAATSCDCLTFLFTNHFQAHHLHL